jgi:hypothetical protein
MVRKRLVRFPECRCEHLSDFFSGDVTGNWGNVKALVRVDLRSGRAFGKKLEIKLPNRHVRVPYAS